jgi:ketosteroid isomerase-like protein
VSTQNVRVMRDAYEAFARRDVPSVLAAFHPEIDFNPPDVIPHGGRCQGHDEVATYFGTLAETFEEFRVEPEEFLDTQDRIIVLGHHRGRANGRAFETPFAHAWTLEDGKAIHMKEYLDPAQMLRALDWQARPSRVAT